MALTPSKLVTALTSPAPVMSVQLAYQAKSVVVSNNTNQYVFVRSASQYVAPGAVGASLSVDTHIGEIVFAAPPGVTQPTVVAGQEVSATWSDAPAAQSAGVIPSQAAQNPQQIGQVISLGSNTLIARNCIIPQGCQSIGVVLSGSHPMTSVTVIGDQSGTHYLDAAVANGWCAVPIPGLVFDSTITVTVVTTWHPVTVSVVALYAPVTFPPNEEQPSPLPVSDGGAAQVFAADGVANSGVTTTLGWRSSATPGFGFLFLRGGYVTIHPVGAVVATSVVVFSLVDLNTSLVASVPYAPTSAAPTAPLVVPLSAVRWESAPYNNPPNITVAHSLGVAAVVGVLLYGT